MVDENLDFDEKSWQASDFGDVSEPFEPDVPEPPESEEKLNHMSKAIAAFVFEFINWLAHLGSLMLANPIANDLFIGDIINVEIPLISDISLGAVFCGLIALVAVTVPYVMAYQVFTKPEILRTPGIFFKDNLNKLIALFLMALYLLVLMSEGASLFMRITQDVAASSGPFTGHSEPTGMTPLVIYSITLMASNLAIGVACAWIMSSFKNTTGVNHA